MKKKEKKKKKEIANKVTQNLLQYQHIKKGAILMAEMKDMQFKEYIESYINFCNGIK